MDTKWAVIADVHANIWALDAVLADIERRGITRIINLGDCLYGMLDPAQTAQRLMQPNMITVSGNQDRELHSPSEAMRQAKGYQFVTSQLTPDQLKWLAELPFKTIVNGEIFCCHATPDDDNTYLLETVTPHGVVLASIQDIEAKLIGVEQKIILCGHSHVPRIVGLSDGRVVVNPGSVGIPAYHHDVPYPHKMEAGSPHARYAILDKQGQDWIIEQIALTYDWQSAVAAAQRNGREDYVYWLAYGRVKEAE